MNHGIVHRLTDDEHGTINAALRTFANDIDDTAEADAVRSLAETIISGEVYIYPRRTS